MNNLIIFNKPRLCSCFKKKNKKNIFEFHPDLNDMFIPFLLDFKSEGLIIAGSDTEDLRQFKNSLVKKTYIVRAKSTRFDFTKLKKRESGIFIEKKKYPFIVEDLQSSGKMVRLKFTVAQEPYGFVNKLLVMSGAKPLVIKRIAIGPVKMDKLPPGCYRPLSRVEIKKIEGRLNV